MALDLDHDTYRVLRLGRPKEQTTLLGNNAERHHREVELQLAKELAAHQRPNPQRQGGQGSRARRHQRRAAAAIRHIIENNLSKAL
jgi:hypothetical protein